MHLPEPDHHDDECVESSELELSGDVAACLDIGTATDTSQTEKATTNEKKTHGCSRSISSLPNACPRFFSIFVRIILPLWLLIALAVLGGFFLAEFEAPNELRNNDLIMANKFTLVRNSNTSDKYADYVAEAPERCFVDFLDGIEVKGTNLTVADIVAEKVNPEVKGTNLTVADIVAEKVNPFGPKDEEILEDIMHDILFLKNFSRYMGECGEKAATRASIFFNFTSNLISLETALEDPTFDWIRCWNESETGPLNPFRPNSKQIEAASSQDIFYYEAWDQDRIRIYNQCVMEHGNFSNEKASEINCYFEAVENATGSKHCSNNIAGTSWFWFTVMTTIGEFFCSL